MYARFSTENPHFMDFQSARIAIEKATQNRLHQVMAQREEILEAFIAKYGFEPGDAEQVEVREADGTTRWFVRKKAKASIE